MGKFEELGYRGQVRCLRQLAIAAILHFPVKMARLDFIQHGENATFKVTDRKRKTYLLKIHRLNYHTENQIKSELQWLNDLSRKTSLKVPVPIRSRKKTYLVKKKNVQFPEGRFISMYHWIDGRFINKRISREQLFQIGKMMATLHNSVAGRNCIRNYWDIQGLIGPLTHFGVLKDIQDIPQTQVRRLEAGRKIIFNKIREYQRKFPQSFGLIHADFHFGNLLWLKEKNFALIDFDDCGMGFFLYDLGIPLVALKSQLEIKKPKQLALCRSQLIEGYRSLRSLPDQELAYLEYFIMARRLLMTVWLNSRRDHPRLRKYLKGFVKNALDDLKKLKLS